MASSICLRCLSRPLASIEQSLVARPGPLAATSSLSQHTSSFSTSTCLAATPPKKKGPAMAVKKGSQYKQGRVGGGNNRAKTGRPPAAGERKAMRKRVVLSNTNALEVRDLEDLTAGNASEAARLGQVMGLSNETVDALRAIEAFKPTQGWSLFRRPATLVRKETLDMAALVNEVRVEKKTVRKVVFGDRGAGKSVLLLQAMAMGFLNNFVVVHIPEAKDLTIGHTSYMPSDANDGSYIQPHYTASLLSAIAKANYNLFSTLKLTQKHSLPVPVPEDISLARLCELGARDPEIAWPFYQALWSELTSPNRPPIVFALDAINHLMRESAYLDVEAQNIHSHDLALVRHFMRLLSGAEKLPNGGLVLAADSNSNRPSAPAFDFALRRNSAAKAGEKDLPSWDPYVQVDNRVLETMKDVDVWKLNGLAKDEARGIMEYYARSGMLRQTVDERLVGEKWTLSGGGIIGQLEKAAVRMRV